VESSSHITTVEPLSVLALSPENPPRSAHEPALGLVEDIDPVPIKERPPLGVVELVLEEGQSVRAFGVVYGIEHTISGEGFTARVFLDQYNQRLRVYSYEATDYEALVLKLRWLAEANGFDKILCMAHAHDWEQFLRRGYVLEAILKYYQNGSDAMVMSKFRSQERLTSHCMMQETLLIEDLMSREVRPSKRSIPEDHEFRLAHEDDIPELTELYRAIFETYPTPLIHASYLEQVLESECIFAVCLHEGRIISAASAELRPELKAAELTDCATIPQARGRGLMSHLLKLLEEDLHRRDYICAYTMARARSFGMNMVFYQLGYEFNGRLVNNCDIHGGYEDMNIWVKDLRRSA
jgi:putative beta-lysine N-acetyltransferase